ncbi:MAG: glutamate--tRNA ligase [Gammaproteobacteria bacterium]
MKTRFCPSPTGLLHLGNLRTALFNALWAKGQQGTFLLRIEDTDKARSDEKYTTALEQDLVWLGLQWNEGPGCEADNGPYLQSQRQTIYDQYYHQLEAKGLVYPCFCSEEQLALARKLQRSAGKPPRYPGTCRHLTADEIAQKLAEGIKPVLRFRVPLEEQTTFDDVVRGPQTFNNNDIGDFIVRRGDGTPPFMYCNAIDDALMGVTYALRGEDHLTNTPRQIMILKALNLPAPQYGHIALIVGADGSPLSKRHGSRSLQALREEGYLPLAINNYLARLGHYYTQEHFMSLAELAQHFSIERLGKAPARFDAAQLLYWQRMAVSQLTETEVWQWLENVHALVPGELKSLFIQAVQPNIIFPAEALKWANILFTDEWMTQPLAIDTPPDFFAVAIKTVQEKGADYPAVTAALKSELNLSGKALFQPLRLALTGELHGPELAAIFALLKEEGLVRRFEKAQMGKAAG